MKATIVIVIALALISIGCQNDSPFIPVDQLPKTDNVGDGD